MLEEKEQKFSIVLHCHLAVKLKNKGLRLRIEPGLDCFFFLLLTNTHVFNLFLFVKVMVMDLMMSLYKEIWMN